MPDARQRVVFGAQHDGQRPGAQLRGERRGQLADASRDRESVRLQELRRPLAGLHFLESQLGVGVNFMAQT